jgi:hypothetical protein
VRQEATRIIQTRTWRQYYLFQTIVIKHLMQCEIHRPLHIAFFDTLLFHYDEHWWGWPSVHKVSVSILAISSTGLTACSHLPKPHSQNFVNVKYKRKSRDSSVGIALGYGLDDRGSRVRFPAGAGNFSLHHRVQNGSGAYPASYPMGTRGSFPGESGRGVKLTTHLHLLPRSKNERSYTSIPHCTFMAWCSVKAQEV